MNLQWVGMLLIVAAIGCTAVLAFAGYYSSVLAHERVDAMQATADDHWDDNRPMFEES
jgi:hypothetical protein